MTRFGALLVWGVLGVGLASADDVAPEAPQADSAGALVVRWCGATEVERRALERALETHGVRALGPLEAAAKDPATPGPARRRLALLARALLAAFHRAHLPEGMAYVPAGTLEIPRTGAPWGPSGKRVAVAAFYIDRHEVTVGDWRQWLAKLDVENADAPALRRRTYVPPKEQDASWPVTRITWNEARAFAKRFRAGRLPTVQEFERAVRGAGVATWPWGTEALKGRANLKGYGPGHLLPVGSYPAGRSPFGVLDLVGNAAEWSATTMAGGRSPLSFRPYVLGGSFQQDPDRRLVWRGIRTRGDAGARRDWVGFRVVRDVPEPSERAAKR